MYFISNTWFTYYICIIYLKIYPWDSRVNLKMGWILDDMKELLLEISIDNEAVNTSLGHLGHSDPCASLAPQVFPTIQPLTPLWPSWSWGPPGPQSARSWQPVPVIKVSLLSELHIFPPRCPGSPQPAAPREALPLGGTRGQAGGERALVSGLCMRRLHLAVVSFSERH